MRALSILLALAAAACSAPSSGPWRPQRPIEFVAASAPGGGTDQFARTVQAIVQQHRLVDTPVVVSNKAGGSGAEAFVYAKGAAGDPHKLIFATNNVWLLPLSTAVGYVSADLRPIATMAVDEFVLWVNARAPYRDAAAFVGDASRAGARLTIAGSMSKDTDQVLVRQIEKATGVSFTYVPFRSGSEAAVQLAGGHVSANLNNPQENLAQWRAGMVRPLCVFASSRLTHREIVASGHSWADIPTCMEAGIPIERYQMPRTVWLPRGVTDEQARFFLDVLTKVRDTPEWKTFITRSTQTDAFMSGDELVESIRTDEARLRAQFAEDGWLVP